MAGRSLQPATTERRARLGLGIGLPLVAAIGAYLPVVIRRDELPDRVASHFDLAGRPDESMTLGGFLLATGIVLAIGLVACVILALVRTPLPEAVGPIVGFLGGFFLGLGAGIVAWTAITQAGLERWQDADAPLWSLFTVLVPAVALGVLGARLASALPTIGGERHVPGQTRDVIVRDPILRVSRHDDRVWTGSIHNPLLTIVGAVSVAAALAIGVLAVAWVGIVLGLTGMVFLTYSSLRVRVDASAVTVTYGLLSIPRTSVALERIAGVRAIEVRPLEWGGWGYRGSLRFMRHAAAVVRGGPGIRLDLRDGKVFVVTVAEAADGVALIDDFLGRPL